MATAPRAPVTWVELGPNGVLIACAITASTSCPEITLDCAARTLQTRATPAGPAFAVTVCEAAIPAGTGAAAIGGSALHVLNGTPKRVAVIGDTGCRLETPDAYQACDDTTSWPFATIAQQIAAWQPDLVIHVGDYLYRQDPCPDGDTGCAGSPTGDTWASWNADFFAPAAPLLSAAPGSSCAATTRPAAGAATAGSASSIPTRCHRGAKPTPNPTRCRSATFSF